MPPPPEVSITPKPRLKNENSNAGSPWTLPPCWRMKFNTSTGLAFTFSSNFFSVRRMCIAVRDARVEVPAVEIPELDINAWPSMFTKDDIPRSRGSLRSQSGAVGDDAPIVRRTARIAPTHFSVARPFLPVS
jgi:hypothetical protein